MNIMTKRGNQDNVVTYEHMCDTTADLANIDPHYITLGSIAIVLQGESEGLEIYIAGSDKNWNSLSTINAGGGGGETTGFSIHICAQNEISNGLPNIISPDETTIYLVPATDTSTGNLYEEYIYVNNAWEKFGSGGANIDLSTLAPKNNPEFTNSISMGRKPSSTIGQNSTTLGNNLVAQGENSYAEGVNSQATGNVSHAEGGNTQATANFSHSEGALTKAQGIASHAEGSQTVASANDAHAEGWGTIANIVAQHVSGSYNIAISEWDSKTTYQVGDMAVRNGALYKCTQANSDTSFTLAHWTEQTSLEPIFIVGNGTDRTRSNAYTLTREGSGYFGGNVYVNCNTDSSGGTQLATINDVLDKLITNPQDGDTLVYDATAGVWKNGEGGGGGEMVIPSFTATMSPQSITCDKTYDEIYTAASQGLVPYALLTVTGMGSMTLQFDGIANTQHVIFKNSQFGTLTGVVDTRQYYEILLFFGEHSRNINISTVESQSPLIIDNDPEPNPD